MAPSPHLEFQAVRLATFKKKRGRRTTSSKAGTDSKQEWPHDSPTPEQLATAGFYHSPSEYDDDNVQCYLCNSSIHGWTPDDDPAEEHLRLSPNCGYAVMLAVSRKDEEVMSLKDSSERMVEARKMTFEGYWPYEKRNGWKPKIDAMVEAGWYHCPTKEAKDLVTCPHCNFMVEGWEKDDDPEMEHLKRNPHCPFLRLPDRLSTNPRQETDARAPVTQPDTDAPADTEFPDLMDIYEQEPVMEDTVMNQQDNIVQTIVSIPEPRTFVAPQPVPPPTVYPPGHWDNAVVHHNLPAVEWAAPEPFQPIDMLAVLQEQAREGQLVSSKRNQAPRMKRILENALADTQASLEEWMKKNAAREEKELKEECEVVVEEFKKEGFRAVDYVRGIPTTTRK